MVQASENPSLSLLSRQHDCLEGGSSRMTPQQFISKWLNSPLKERAAAQEHFVDLCRMLGEPTPPEADPTGKDYGFEVGATKTTGGNGFADVFKRGFFAWEYKKTKANLDTAFVQLQRYAIALDNPPLLIVSDIGTTIRIHTNWTNSVSKVYTIPIAELGDPEKRGWLKAALSDPEELRPTKTRQQLTEQVAGEFAELARSLRAKGHNPEQVAHFINRLVFCMFAEDVKLLPDKIFIKMLERALDDPSQFEAFASSLFAAMRTGGHVGFEKVAWFNGGLFEDDLVFPLDRSEIAIVHRAAQHYWGDIDPSILGTLFERGLDPDKRSQLGAHYTDRDKIMMIINPVIVEPLTAEWEQAKAEIAALMDKAASSKGGAATKARNQAQGVLDAYLKRLGDFRVLDPACGSGNFLYLALRSLKDLEHRAQVEAEALGLPRGFPRIGPEVVKGIEINPYAAELARVSVWIGEIQWMLKNGFAASDSPILKPLHTIECRDALISWEQDIGTGVERWVEAQWPKADVIVGNPPFLGANKFRRELGQHTTDTLRSVYKDKVDPSADLVAYWFYRLGKLIGSGEVSRGGFVCTSALRAGNNLTALDKIIDEKTAIFHAYSDLPWDQDGANVRVSLICLAKRFEGPRWLDGRPVDQINSDLTDFRFGGFARAKPLTSNKNVSFQGSKKVGNFEIPGELARELLKAPLNPNGRPNSDVIRRSWLSSDMNQRDRDVWIVDFGTEMSEEEAALYEQPFALIEEAVGVKRKSNRRASRAANWWRHGDPQPAMREAIRDLDWYLVTPEVTSIRLFVRVPKQILPDCKLMVIAKSDYLTFGILQSRFHDLWARFNGGVRGVSRTYTPRTTFETFPFPDGLTPDIPAVNLASDHRAVAIAEAAKRLNELRDHWLNPPDLVKRVPEVVPGYPDRILPVDDVAAEKLKKRTLINLYNERPAWLQHAHKALDEAVAAAYGWPADLPDDEVLARLFELNQQRAAKQ